MPRRTLTWSVPGFVLAFALAGSGCTATSPSNVRGEQMDKRHTIDAGVDSTLSRLYVDAKDSRELVSKARGVPIFPSVIDAGFVVGGQYSEGSLRVDGHTIGYYSTATGSLGWQIGANGNVDASTATGQVDAFVLTNNGLMAGASLEGTKVTRLNSL
ncbi:hypothetical protein LMG28688_06785 [Paraburkholderia caffeinitolerans]|uniref:Ysc84 actin-binding domain-containing protein n=1 Tax=Paraburkholderia caffeinitolerans TaxID=1723730 RepID=A0A6J5GZ92_9BURK|nr:twin-arginine translocation pathway signal [Paraburkholderia caffeinitolerans]CAB3808513.1 hypothetical protein LMG28688_06785 [Paraburkholderia caffeinitolerans]